MKHDRVSRRRWVRRLDFGGALTGQAAAGFFVHLSYTLPNPLARLTGLLDVLERSRATATPGDENSNKTPNKADDRGDGPRADHHDDLESLSLSREGASLEPSTHDLDALSLCRVEEHPAGAGDLDDASLSRTPKRPPL